MAQHVVHWFAVHTSASVCLDLKGNTVNILVSQRATYLLLRN